MSTTSAQSTARKRVLMLVSNPAVSDRASWPIGFWWAERPTTTGSDGQQQHSAAAAARLVIDALGRRHHR